MSKLDKISEVISSVKRPTAYISVSPSESVRKIRLQELGFDESQSAEIVGMQNILLAEQGIEPTP